MTIRVQSDDFVDDAGGEEIIVFGQFRKKIRGGPIEDAPPPSDDEETALDPAKVKERKLLGSHVVKIAIVQVTVTESEDGTLTYMIKRELTTEYVYVEITKLVDMVSGAVLDRKANEALPRREASHRRMIDVDSVKREMAEAGFTLQAQEPPPAADRFLLAFEKARTP